MVSVVSSEFCLSFRCSLESGANHKMTNVMRVWAHIWTSNQNIRKDHFLEVFALWQDTAGQERFHALGPIYYRDADGHFFSINLLHLRRKVIHEFWWLCIIEPHFISYGWLQQLFWFMTSWTMIVSFVSESGLKNYSKWHPKI